ncbi:MAG: AAA family ATPase [Verrucomicrobiales bacterium]
MLTRVTISNYRSFVQASADLSPFTLVIGANGAGKTNFLRFFRDINLWESERFKNLPEGEHPAKVGKLMPHLNHLDEETSFGIEADGLKTPFSGHHYRVPFPGRFVPIYRIDPSKVSVSEKVGTSEPIRSDGSGVIAMLDTLKTGAREDLFDRIESDLIEFIPDVEKLSLAPAGEGMKTIQISHTGVRTPIPGKFLSDGTRTLLALLTIVHQPSPPPLLLIEDMDHSIHPRLFEDFVGAFRRVAEERQVQIIATSHNPYLLDCFQEDPDSVLLIEKENGASTIRSLGPELQKLREQGGASLALSKLYLSGFLSDGQ